MKYILIAFAIGSPFFLIGVILLILGMHSHKECKKYFSESKVIVGEIIDVVRERTGDASSAWYPIFRYWDERINEYLIYKSNAGHTFRRHYTIGDKVELRYLYTENGADIRFNPKNGIKL